MTTLHKIHFADARNLSMIDEGSVDLFVTSPPYPMIQMWDKVFSLMNPEIEKSLSDGRGIAAFEMMHTELDKVWRELDRVTKDSAFICINIGDATRSFSGEFALYSNHSRIINAFMKLGFTSLPLILWRKQTNAPNKFMGSGMLGAGAYVTLEHEYILIFRKGARRVFRDSAAKKRRRESAFFWEERNQWFSDIWDFKGTRQKLLRADLRERSAAFPFELPWRLVNMYSVEEDTVLDPFAGTGTSLHAAAACGRNSIGVETDKNFGGLIFGDPLGLKTEFNKITERRIKTHNEFIESFVMRGGSVKYINKRHGFPVVTRQEIEIRLKKIDSITRDDTVRVSYNIT